MQLKCSVAQVKEINGMYYATKRAPVLLLLVGYATREICWNGRYGVRKCSDFFFFSPNWIHCLVVIEYLTTLSFRVAYTVTATMTTAINAFTVTVVWRSHIFSKSGFAPIETPMTQKSRWDYVLHRLHSE